MARDIARFPVILALALAISSQAWASDVSGRVDLPEVCASSVSPAVVRLEPVDGRAFTPSDRTTEVVLIDQRGLSFDPRVVALTVGQPLRFGNADPETHNVHVRGPGTVFNRNVPPGETVEFVPERGGVFKVSCDVHQHMRAYVIVGASPWVTACDRAGGFRFREVPEGRYRLLVWNEMSEPVGAEVEVGPSDLGLGTLSPKLGPNPATAQDREEVCLTGCEPWPLVIDRISVTLASSLAAARRPETAGRAVALAQDAFHRDLEASGLSTAIRVHLGADRAARVEDSFREIARSTRGVVESGRNTANLVGPTRAALLQLVDLSGELTRKGVTERSNIFGKTSPAFFVEEAAGRDAASRVRPWRPTRGLWLGFGIAVPVLVLLLLASRFGPARTRVGRTAVPKRRVAFLAAIVVVASVAIGHFLDSEPPGVGAQGGATASRTPGAPDEAPLRAHPIGLGIEVNRLRIAAVWHRPVVSTASPARVLGAIHLSAKVHASEGNPNGFAKGEWVPYLNVRYTIKPLAGRAELTGHLRPTVGADGPRYGTNLTMPGPGDYRLTLRIEPPTGNGLDRVVDPVAGVAPWWEPFEVSETWTYRPE